MSDYSRQQELVSAANDAAGASTEQYEKTMDSLQTAFNKLKNAWDEFAMGIANNGIIRVAVNALTGLLSIVNKLTGAFGALPSAIMKIGLGFGALKGGKVVLSSFISAFNKIGKEGGAEFAKNFANSLKEALPNTFKNLGEVKGLFKLPKSKSEEIIEDLIPKGDIDEDKFFLDQLDALDEIEELKKKDIITNTEHAASEIVDKNATDLNTASKLDNLKATVSNAAAKVKNTAMTKLAALATRFSGQQYMYEAGAIKLASGEVVGLTGALSVLLGPILLLTGGIMALYYSYRALKDNSPEGKLNSAAEASELASEEAEKAAESYNKLTESLENIKNSESSLDTLVEGTKEWKDAVIDLNNQVLQLIDDYPELAQFLSNQNGRLTIDYKTSNAKGETAEDIITKAQNRVIETQIASQAAKTEELSAKNNFSAFETGKKIGDDTGAYGAGAVIRLAEKFNNGEKIEGIENWSNETIIALSEFANELQQTSNSVSEMNSVIANNAIGQWDLTKQEQTKAEQFLTSNKMEQLINNKINSSEIQNESVVRKKFSDMYNLDGYTVDSATKAIKSGDKEYSWDSVKQQVATAWAVEDAKEYFKAFSEGIKNTAKNNPDMVEEYKALFNNGIGLSKDQAKTLQNKTNEDWQTYLDQMATNMGFEDKDDLATQLGYDSVNAMITAISNAAEEATNMWDSVTKNLDIFSEDIPEDIKSIFENNKLNNEQQKNLSNTFKEIALNGGKVGSSIDSISSIFDKIKEANLNSSDLEKAINLITTTDFTNSDDIKSTINQLQEMGIEISGDFYDKIIHTTNAINNISFESLETKLAELQEVLDLVQEGETKFSKEQMDKLVAQGINANDFVRTGIDEYTYNGETSLLETINGNIVTIIGQQQEQLQKDIQTGQDVGKYLNIWGLTTDDLENYVNSEEGEKGGLNNYQIDKFAKILGIDTTSLNAEGIKAAIGARYQEVYGENGSKLEDNQANQTRENQELLASKYIESGDSYQALQSTAISSEALTRSLDAAIDSEAGLRTEFNKTKEALIKQNPKLAENDNLIKALILDNNKAEKSIDNLNLALEENKDALDDSNRGNDSYNAALENVTKEAKKVFGNYDWINSDFVEEHKIDFMKMLEGGPEAEAAFHRIGVAAAQAGLEIGWFGEFTEQELNQIKLITNEIDGSEFDITGTADCSQAFTELANLMGSAQKAAAYIESLGGYTVEFEQVDVKEFNIQTPSISPLTNDLIQRLPDSVTKIKTPTFKAVVKKNNSGGTKGFAPSGGGGGKGGGGGGGSSKKEPAENTLDKYYNKVQDINQLLRNRNKLEQEYQNSIKNGAVSLKEYQDYYEDTIASLEDERKKQEELKGLREGQIRDLVKGSKYKDYAWYDFGKKEVQIDYEKFDKLATSDPDAYNEAVEYKDKLEDLEGKVDDCEDSLLDIKTQEEEIKAQMRDDTIEFINRLAEALEAIDQEEIDNQEKIYNAINEARTDLLDSVQENIEAVRQLRDNQEKEDEIAEKQRRLAYLRQDTTGNNILEIKQLEDELDNLTVDYEDTLVDQALSNLQDEAAYAAEQRERQIEALQSQLEWNKENGIYAAEAKDLLEEYLKTNNPENIVNTLHEAEHWEGKSDIEIEDLVAKAINSSNIGATYLRDRDKDTDSSMYDSYGGFAGEIKRLIESEGGPQNLVKGTSLYDELESLNKRRNAKIKESNLSYKTYNSIEDYIKDNYKDETESDEKQKGAIPIVADYTGLEYTVKSGDTLSSIANDFNKKGYNTTAEKIAQDNNLSLNSILKLNSKLRVKKYAKGGLVNSTGLAWLDGNTANPEIVLNAKDSQHLLQLRDVMRRIDDNNFGTDSLGSYMFDIDINVDELGSDYDVDMLSDRIKADIVSAMNYRNVNAIGFMK